MRDLFTHIQHAKMCTERVLKFLPSTVHIYGIHIYIYVYINDPDRVQL